MTHQRRPSQQPQFTSGAGTAAPHTLILFTSTYPYEGEQTFLGPEIPYLASAFDRVILVPGKLKGTRGPLPSGVLVDESLAHVASSKPGVVLRAMRSRLLYRELLANPRILLYPKALMYLVWFTGQAEHVKDWVLDLIARENLDLEHCLFYTYWFVQQALGIGLAKKRHPKIKLISRAHGYDIYAERRSMAYIPFRAESMQAVDILFPDSKTGTEYILRRYPHSSVICETRRMGVPDPGFLASFSTDGCFRLVSCSRMVPLKRLDLIMKGILHAAETRPSQMFEWHHLGTGPLHNDLETKVARGIPANVKIRLHGYVEDPMLFYRDNPVDLFINASRSEGTPVSLMEAISCGIPAAATSVGGNSEIVSERNGILMSTEPEPAEITKAILVLLDNPTLAAEKRLGARQVWQEKYSADANYQSFAAKIRGLLSQESSSEHPGGPGASD